MQPRPYKLFGARERALLKELLEQKLDDWARDWLPTRIAPRLECAPAPELAGREARFFADLKPADWLVFAGAGGEWWAVAAGEGQIEALAATLCGNVDVRTRRWYAGRSGIAVAAAHSALHELAAALIQGDVSQTTRVVPVVSYAGSASIAASVALGEAPLRLVSSPQWTLRVLKQSLPAPAPGRFVDRRQAIASRTVELRVVAGWAELDLGELRGLQAGDVIALDAPIERPMSVVVGARAAPVCGARLGLLEGHKAAALTASR
jgi:hypothetical protein